MRAREMHNKLDKLSVLSLMMTNTRVRISRCSALKIRTGWTRCSRKFAKLKNERGKRHYRC